MPDSLAVMHLVHSFPPDTRGGIEHHVEALAAAQRGAGHRVLVACGGMLRADGGGGDGESGAGWTVRRLGDETERERAERSARAEPSAALAALETWLEAERPDVLHVHHFAATGPGPVVLASRLGIASVVTLHDLHPICPLFFRLRPNAPPCPPEVDEATCVACLVEATGESPARVAPWFGDRANAFRADLATAGAVTAPSSTLADYLRSVPLLEGVAVECLGFPRADAPAERGRVRARPAGSPLAVATWGGLVPGKGLGLLVEAAGLLPRGALELHHHGPVIDTRHAEACVARARALGVALTLHGPFARAELAARLAGVDVAAHPSSFLETYGLTTDEAHGLGLPVVVSDRGAPRERLGGRGMSFRADDARDLARVLGELLDGEQLARLARGAPPALLPIEVYVARLDDLYRRVVRVARARRRDA